MNVKYLCAETHTSEYLMHKYWARKPHNVLSECFKQLINDNDSILIDPFCGSGVALREAALLGIKGYGFDLNPIAVLISKNLNAFPEINSFSLQFESIFKKIYSKYSFLYKTEENENIRYVCHRIVAKCSCGKIVRIDDALKQGKRILCPNCGKILRYNLENLEDTEIFDVILEKKDSSHQIDFKKQNDLSKLTNIKETDLSKYDYEFPHNKRILSYSGLKTSDFFTKRNFLILSSFADEFWEIKDDKIRNFCLMLLTGSAAQCSRLIAYRNNMETGGPAWSIPGFWVPLEHLETNPFIHLRARYEKYLKALKLLNESKPKAEFFVEKGDCLELLKSKKYESLKADLIFLDPPYGDSVPYTEFSNIWNSFLKEIPNSDLDISVSDRIDKKLSWDNYFLKLNQCMNICKNHLKEKGALLITFNNNDLRAWEALIRALQNNGFICDNVFYQIPAVISSKAQKAIKSSYISDVYSVFKQNSTSPSNNLSQVITDLIKIANYREGKVQKNIVDREFILSWLRNNISCDLLYEKENIISELFITNEEEQILILKEKYIKPSKKLCEEIYEKTKALLELGPTSLIEAYKKVGAELSDLGTIEYNEFVSAIDGKLIISNNQIIGLSLI